MPTEKNFDRAGSRAKAEELDIATEILHRGHCTGFKQTTPEEDKELGYDVVFDELRID